MIEGPHYETFEHTADIGLYLYGRSLSELFEAAVKAVLELSAGGEGVEARQSRRPSGRRTAWSAQAWPRRQTGPRRENGTVPAAEPPNGADRACAPSSSPATGTEMLVAAASVAGRSPEGRRPSIGAAATV